MRLTGKNPPPPAVEFEKHQPERRRGSEGRVLCNGGCCCCSCCLHSLGGLIGAAVASGKIRPTSESSSIKTGYWLFLGSLTVLLFIFSAFSSPGAGVLAVLLLLPLVQLMASLLTLIWIRMRWKNLTDPKASLKNLGKITLWSFLGALAGLIVMLVGLKMLSWQ